MDLWNYWSVGYVSVGLLVAAVVYHAFSGGFDHYVDKVQQPCECCGKEPHLTHEERDDIHQFEKVQLMRENPRGRFLIAVVTAIVCLICVVTWPIAVPAFLISFALKMRARGRR